MAVIKESDKEQPGREKKNSLKISLANQCEMEFAMTISSMGVGFLLSFQLIFPVYHPLF